VRSQRIGGIVNLQGRVSLDLPRPALSGSSPVPLYAQLADTFRRLIVEEVWQRGGLLPSEPAIARHFGVSRNTVRQALLALDNECFVTRVQGLGTHVTLPSAAPWSMDSRPNLSAAAAARGLTLVTEPIEVGIVSTPDWAARRLEIRPGDSSLLIERRRRVAGDTVNFSRNYLPARLAPLVMAADLGATSLYDLLRREAGLQTHGATRVIVASGLDRTIARALDVAEGEPVVVIESSVWDEHGVVFDCHRVWHRTSVMPLEVGFGDARADDLGAAAPNALGAADSAWTRSESAGAPL
jgi:GntR family transcriptional regulator